MLREEIGREAIPSAVSIDSQSIKKAPFVSEDTGIDGNKNINGRKRHILTDTLGLVWVAVVDAANLHDGVMTKQVVSPILGYLHRVKKVLADMAYKVELGEWLEQMHTSIELEISSRMSKKLINTHFSTFISSPKRGFRPKVGYWLIIRAVLYQF